MVNETISNDPSVECLETDSFGIEDGKMYNIAMKRLNNKIAETLSKK